MNIEKKQEIQVLLDQSKSIIIDFYADWCPPCKKLMPVFNDVANDDKFREIVFLKVNVDVCPELAGDYKITTIPTLLFLGTKNTQEKRISGFVAKEALTNEIIEWLQLIHA